MVRDAVTSLISPQFLSTKNDHDNIPLNNKQVTKQTMTLPKQTVKAPAAIKRTSIAKHSSSKAKRAVRFSIKPSPELVGDSYLQSTDKRRRYMRRGSRSPSMLAIHAVRSSAEVAAIEAFDSKQEKLERQQRRSSLTQVIRRSFSLPFTKESVNHDLARCLFHKTNLTTAQRRRLSLEILSRVQLESGGLSSQSAAGFAALPSM